MNNPQEIEGMEERFKELFCRLDKSDENRGYMLNWFLRDDITAKEMLAFLHSLLKAQEERLVGEVKQLPDTYEDNESNVFRTTIKEVLEIIHSVYNKE